MVESYNTFLIFVFSINLLLLLFVIISFKLQKYMSVKYKNILEHRNLFRSVLSINDSQKFWKEIISPSHKIDKEYIMLINIFRIIVILFVIIIVYWWLWKP